MKTFIVAAESKQDFLTHLETLCDINEEELFPDFPGFAVSNGSDKTYDVLRSVSYWYEQIGLARDDSARAKAHYRCGVAFSAIKKAGKAIEQYSAAIELKPEARAYEYRGAAKADLGLYREAIADYSEAIRISPEYATSYNNRGVVRLALGLYEGAAGDFGKVIDINQENAEAYNNRGLARKSLGQFSAAVEDFEKARLLAKNQGNCKAPANASPGTRRTEVKRPQRGPLFPGSSASQRVRRRH